MEITDLRVLESYVSLECQVLLQMNWLHGTDFFFKIKQFLCC